MNPLAQHYNLPKEFFDRIRGVVIEVKGKKVAVLDKSLTQGQVDNCNHIYRAFLLWGDNDARKLAYCLATARGEVGSAMAPVRETFAKTDAGAIAALDKVWAAGKLPSVKTPYWREGWFGRGYAQVTHRDNYAKVGALIGFDLVKDPSALLNPEIAAEAMVAGMMQGVFTGRRLSQYFDKIVDWEGARRIINGTDRDEEFAEYGDAFHNALKGVVFPLVPKDTSETEPKAGGAAPANNTQETAKETSMELGWWTRILVTVAGSAVTGAGYMTGDEVSTATAAVTTLVALGYSVFKKFAK